MRPQDDILVERYREAVGHEPQNLAHDHPALWQWLYRGTPADRKRLEEIVIGLEQAQTIYEQEVLFT